MISEISTFWGISHAFLTYFCMAFMDAVAIQGHCTMVAIATNQDERARSFLHPLTNQDERARSFLHGLADLKAMQLLSKVVGCRPACYYLIGQLKCAFEGCNFLMSFNCNATSARRHLHGRPWSLPQGCVRINAYHGENIGFFRALLLCFTCKRSPARMHYACILHRSNSARCLIFYHASESFLAGICFSKCKWWRAYTMHVFQTSFICIIFL